AALEARTLSSIAARSTSPVAWDRAAESWSALATALHRGEALGEARYQVALARWSAWRLDRSAARRAAAAAALDRYLAGAPAGPRRDQARQWRGAVGPWGRPGGPGTPCAGGRFPGQGVGLRTFRPLVHRA